MWTKEKDERLVRLWNDGEDMIKLPLLMRCSFDDCFKRLSELGQIGGKKENDEKLVEPELKAPDKIWETKYFLSKKTLVKLNLICLSDKIGVVIGKSHRAINRIKSLSRAQITINPCHDVDDGEDNKIISISAIEILEEHSPTEFAAFELLRLCSDNSGGSYRVRLLVDEAQNDCLDEKFLSLWRSITDTEISVIERKQNYEIQIIGERSAVERAYIQVVLRVRKQAFKVV